MPTRRLARFRQSSALAQCVLTTAAIAGGAIFLIDTEDPVPLRADVEVGSEGTGKADIVSRLPAPGLIRLVSPEEALSANAKRPVLRRRDTPADAFMMRADAHTKSRALDCLTQAVYYEAASEGVDGGRAVAQVILNRVRHPGYPNSVCGVVYQGATRSTGCQFTFTCDGSLARSPLAYLWARSRRIAMEALAGRVFAPIGHATHYHADYVLPYWADSLDKVAVIGRHIMYRLRGASGVAGAFAQRYGAAEPTPPPPPPTDVIERSLTAMEAPASLPLRVLSEVEEDRVETINLGPKAETEVNSTLAADLTRGTLILGEPPIPSKPKTKATDRCASDGARKVKAVANDFASGTTSSIC